MDPHKKRNQIVGNLLVQGLRKLDGEEVLLGTVRVFGISAHALFVRVRFENRIQEPVRDPCGRWDAFVEVESEGVFQTIEVPGFEGQYVFLLSPYLQ